MCNLWPVHCVICSMCFSIVCLFLIVSSLSSSSIIIKPVKKEFYFFSAKGEDQLIPLKISNLRKTYSSNLKFQGLLDEVKSDEELTYYVGYMQQLKVEYIFKKSHE